MTTRAPASALLLLALAGGMAAAYLLAAHPLAAQAVEGQVVDPDAGLPLPGVHLELLDADDRAATTAFSDDSGHFHLPAPRPGHWRIAAELLGYGSVRSDSLELAEGDTIRVQVRMGVDPVTIDEPVVVIGDRRMSPDIEEFHRRRAWGERAGLGHFIYGEELERAVAGRPTDLFRMIPGATVSGGRSGRDQIVRMRGGCIPAIYVDGSQINRAMRGESLDTYVALPSIEGIEVYQGAQQPGGRFVDRTGCGLILVWTKRGQREGDAPFSWGRLLFGLGLITGVFILF